MFVLAVRVRSSCSSSLVLLLSSVICYLFLLFARCSLFVFGFVSLFLCLLVFCDRVICYCSSFVFFVISLVRCYLVFLVVRKRVRVICSCSLCVFVVRVLLN